MSEELERAVAVINATVQDAKQGLLESVFYMVSRLTPLINVDLLIKNEAGQYLLTWRDDRHYGPGWHIPGGIIRFKERWEDRIAAVAMGELGATVAFEPNPILIQQAINPSRDIRGHFISMLFACTLASPADPNKKAMSDHPNNGEWAWITGCPDNLIQVHHVLYGKVLK